MIIIIPKIPCKRVEIVCVFSAVWVSIPENWATTQKKLSFKCDTVIAPAPSASTVNALPNEESKPNDILFTCYTIVWHNNKALGKPRDENDAFKILKSLSNETHEVITSVSFTTTTYE